MESGTRLVSGVKNWGYSRVVFPSEMTLLSNRDIFLLTFVLVVFPSEMTLLSNLYGEKRGLAQLCSPVK